MLIRVWNSCVRFRGWLYGDFKPWAFWWNTRKTELAITWRKFQLGLSYPGWKIPCNRTKKFQPGLKRWLTDMERYKLAEQQKQPTNSCLGLLPISVSSRAEIFSCNQLFSVRNSSLNLRHLLLTDWTRGVWGGVGFGPDLWPRLRPCLSKTMEKVESYCIQYSRLLGKLWPRGWLIRILVCASIQGSFNLGIQVLISLTRGSKTRRHVSQASFLVVFPRCILTIGAHTPVKYYFGSFWNL